MAKPNNCEPSGRCHLLIRNATVVDGSGSTRFNADVAVESDRIAAVGELADWHSDATIDATGQVLSPGFIDVHTHDDLAAIKTPDMTFKVSQGVTTVIAGNCGLSLAPFQAGRGFPPPFARAARGPGRSFVMDILKDRRFRERGWWNPEACLARVDAGGYMPLPSAPTTPAETA